MNFQIGRSSWRNSEGRPFAPSLERLRLQLYLVVFLADLAIIIASFIATGYIRSGDHWLSIAVLQGFLLTIIFMMLALHNRTYCARSLIDAGYALRRAFSAFLMAEGLLLFITFFLKVSYLFSRLSFALGTILTIVLMILLRLIVVRYVHKFWGPDAQNILVIKDGGPPVSIAHAYSIDANDEMLYLDVNDPGALDRLGRCVENMDRVVVSCHNEKRHHWAFYLRAAGVNGELVSEVGHDIGPIGINSYKDFSTMIVSSKPLPLNHRATKRIFDLIVAGASLLFLGPLMMLVALSIKVEDGGCVFFMQRRMGRGNRYFNIFKFRSMREVDNDQHGRNSAGRDDDRFTRVGKFIRRTSIDELPQLLNVLRGEMSLVGPRPHALGSKAGARPFWQIDSRYWHRHSLRPGITGLAQVRGYRGATDCESDLAHRLHFDLDYISNWTILRDIYILLLTVRVLSHKNAF